MRRVAALITTALMVASCAPGRSLDCGPLDRARCEQEAVEIVSVVQRDNPGRTVRSIEFLDADGHARVMLDNGKAIGWGERL